MKTHDLVPHRGSRKNTRRVGRGIPPVDMTADTCFKNRQRVEYVALNVGQLKTYAVDGRVSPETLAAKGLIEATAKVKLLANGEVGQKLEVHAHKVSGAARQKVESAGGTVVLIDAGTS